MSYNIISGYRATEIITLNQQKVLDKIPKEIKDEIRNNTFWKDAFQIHCQEFGIEKTY